MPFAVLRVSFQIGSIFLKHLVNNYLRNIGSFSFPCLFLLLPAFARVGHLRNERILLCLAHPNCTVWDPAAGDSRLQFPEVCPAVLALLVRGLRKHWRITRV